MITCSKCGATMRIARYRSRFDNDLTEITDYKCDVCGNTIQECKGRIEAIQE